MEEIKSCKVDTKKLWISQKEAKTYLGVGKDWLQERRDSGELHFSKIGKTIFYIKSEIDNLVRKNAITGRHSFLSTY